MILVVALVLISATACSERLSDSESLGVVVPVELFADEDIILGRPTDRSVVLFVLAREWQEVFVEYSQVSGKFDQRTANAALSVDGVAEILVPNLAADSQYFYRIGYLDSDDLITYGEEHRFRTQRAENSAFSFGVQGDSHPERTHQMFNSELYELTMRQAENDLLDLYFMLGDDFSITGHVPPTFIDRNYLTQQLIDNVYINQRKYLSILGDSTAIYSVNGNHEEARRSLLDTRLEDITIFAARAKKKFFPLPYPSDFYSGNDEVVPDIGLLGDYFAFEWGDALFLSLDPYWHGTKISERIGGQVPENSIARAMETLKQISGMNEDQINKTWQEQSEEYVALTRETGDWWDATIGDQQYHWLKATLEESDARFKFVFTHHVLGTGRGGIERATRYEWGGYNDDGVWEFDSMRPNWDAPIHQLLVENGVSIVFQAHDHLFAHQELDGVVYQSVPNPADHTYRAFFAEAYTSGHILPNSGYLNVSVSGDGVEVNYIRSFLPQDRDERRVNGKINYTYRID